ncbi:MAG: VOC family protein [Gammaproteobacteria bacterium]|nr:VOC family protein [Gammaproteobacteria bacterium]MDH3466009.1 VOC family protein [Gammaproteobacteria bacterium]
MKTSCLDHIVIGAATLDEGVAYVRSKLGVMIPPGGNHTKMATHNCVMSLGHDVYLEVIAVDPNANAPLRPRWFGLDDPYVKARLQRQPALLTWLVNCANIESVVAQNSFPFGAVTSMCRGDLEWSITLPADGGLPAAGMLPTLLQWRTDDHPARRMADTGCTLQRLQLYHPHIEWIESILAGVGALDCIERNSIAANATPYLVAHIMTPSGVRQFFSHH